MILLSLNSQNFFSVDTKVLLFKHLNILFAVVVLLIIQYIEVVSM